jgi:DNA-binding protein H-NS
MNLQDLQAQKAAIEAKIAEATAAQAEAKAEAITAMKSLATQFGILAREVFDPVKADVKYRGPAGETWTGRGLVPKWLRDMEVAGHDRTEFLVS